MDENLAQFTAITSAEPERAAQYLQLTDNNLEQALQLYFESDGVDMGGSLPTPQAPSTAPQPLQSTDPIQIDSDAEDDAPNVAAAPEPPRGGFSVESDEEMARRLQQEMYGSTAGPGDAAAPMEEVRAPIGRQAETLSGPYADWRDDPDEMRAAILEQMQARQQRRTPASRPGIFNQDVTPDAPEVWEENSPESESRRRQQLARATGGASETSSKSNMLAELFRPPFELISKLRTWEGVRAAGKEDEKWILVNIQEPNIFDCQVLNRDIWKDAGVQETVREHFIFKQYKKDDPQAADYIRFYFQNHESPDAYPHIAIVDPRTGEQMKVWSGAPAPKAPDFLMQLHEFLDRYSLKAFAKNPVAKRKAPERRETDINKMSEEEMMQMAVQNSLGGSSAGLRDDDPDLLTRSGTLPEREAPLTPTASASKAANGDSSPLSPFKTISSANPHDEPDQGGANVTRIQFRHPGGRVVRRFSLTDPVRRLYEWLKASPMEGKDGTDFELIFMGKNLIDSLDATVEEAGLKNGTVMVEYL